MNEKTLLLKTTNQLKKLEINKVTHCLASGSYTEFYTYNTLLTTETKNLKSYRAKLETNNFIEVSRGVLINLYYVTQIKKEDDAMYIILENFQKFKIAVRRIKQVKEQFIQYLQIA